MRTASAARTCRSATAAAPSAPSPRRGRSSRKTPTAKSTRRSSRAVASSRPRRCGAEVRHPIHAVDDEHLLDRGHCRRDEGAVLVSPLHDARPRVMVPSSAEVAALQRCARSTEVIGHAMAGAMGQRSLPTPRLESIALLHAGRLSDRIVFASGAPNRPLSRPCFRRRPPARMCFAHPSRRRSGYIPHRRTPRPPGRRLRDTGGSCDASLPKCWTAT